MHFDDDARRWPSTAWSVPINGVDSGAVDDAGATANEVQLAMDNNRWQFARDAWTASFAPLADAGYRWVRFSDDETYFNLHEATLRASFPPEFFFRVEALNKATRPLRDRLTKVRADGRLEDFTALYRDDTLAAMFCGHQQRDDEYRMWHTNIAPAFRRQGLYTQILKSTIAYTQGLGFSTISSEHAPGNNAVLIAKMSVGFRITSMDIDAGVGLSVKLTYFHNQDELDLYQFRTGLAVLNPRITATGFGAFEKLKAQITTPSDSK